MEIKARHRGDILVLDMTGRLDTSTSGSAHDAIVDFTKTQPKKVVLNLAKLDYVSSAGLRVILTLAKLLQSSNGELKICRPNGSVNEVLQTSGFNRPDQDIRRRELGYRVLDLISRPGTPQPVPWCETIATASILFCFLRSRVLHAAPHETGEAIRWRRRRKFCDSRGRKEQLRELKMHSRAKTPVAKIAKAMKRTVGALRQKAFQLGMSLGHQR